jgi:hypothetical protein
MKPFITQAAKVAHSSNLRCLYTRAGGSVILTERELDGYNACPSRFSPCANIVDSLVTSMQMRSLRFYLASIGLFVDSEDDPSEDLVILAQIAQVALDGDDTRAQVAENLKFSDETIASLRKKVSAIVTRGNVVLVPVELGDGVIVQTVKELPPSDEDMAAFAAELKGMATNPPHAA